ncbi:MAG: ribonuclease HI [Clostridia bacterium]|jgi:ribonuclease HI|nr:ribonuclease HI [Clostridia bacterium]MCI2000128.1 ribonuclease HI [Clostridia bacterium]MCI2014707.1 ribonuclease HI [Clostridia bacterium]
MKTVDIYTDGACSGNPGNGGYGAVLMYGGRKKELSQGYELTTNNRMEILAVIAALSALKEPCSVNLYSDSKYVVDAINKGWMEKWKKNNWMRTKTEKASNSDLWIKLDNLLKEHSVNFIWVKGHADNLYNERCDELARKAASGENLLKDERYKA